MITFSRINYKCINNRYIIYYMRQIVFYHSLKCNKIFPQLLLIKHLIIIYYNKFYLHKICYSEFFYGVCFLSINITKNGI